MIASRYRRRRVTIDIREPGQLSGYGAGRPLGMVMTPIGGHLAFSAPSRGLAGAESFLTIMRSLMDKMFASDEPLVSPDSDNPMQDLMSSPAKDDVLALLKLVTWNAVQKVLPMMKGPGQVDPALLGLDRATVRIKPGNVAEYRLKPGRLITHWVEERGQYKIDEFGFKVNWFWVIWNWRTVRELRRQRAEAEAEAQVN